MRIDGGSFPRGDGEVSGGEQVHVVKKPAAWAHDLALSRCPLEQSRVVPALGRHGREEVGAREQGRPERIDGVRAGEPSRHADDGDVASFFASGGPDRGRARRR